MLGGDLIKTDSGNIWVTIFPARVPECANLPAGRYCFAMRFVECEDGTETCLTTLFPEEEAARLLYTEIVLDEGDLLSLDGKDVTLEFDTPLRSTMAHGSGGCAACDQTRRRWKKWHCAS